MISETKARTMETKAIFAVLALAAGATAMAADPERGRMLYETRCDICHGTGVHLRASRKASSFEAIRAQVRRWDRELGASWSREEIEDVSVYLNDRFYLYPCPPNVCGNVRGGNAAAARRIAGKKLSD